MDEINELLGLGRTIQDIDLMFECINNATEQNRRKTEAAAAEEERKAEAAFAERERKRAIRKALKESDDKLLLAAIGLGFTASGVLGFLLGMGYHKAVSIATAAIFAVLLLGEVVFGKKKRSVEER